MQYDLGNPLDRERFAVRVDTTLRKNAVVDLTEKVFRSPSQNRYLHLLIGVVAMECGVSIEYAKQEYFKRLVNHEIFAYEEQDPILGKTVEKLRSSIMPPEQLNPAIEKFKAWGREQGWRMPDADEERILRLIEIEMGRNRWL